MIGVDTNVLLRHTLQDDAVQAPIATAFLLAAERLAEPALVNPVVLIEFVWTLMRREGFTKSDLLALMDLLAASPHVVFTDRTAICAAIADWRIGRADFPDYLIGHLNRLAGASTTVTFDVDAAAEPAFSLLTS